LPQIYGCLIIKASCDENKLMMLVFMKMMGILEKILCLYRTSPLWLRGSEGRHHIIHVSCTMDRTNSRKPNKDTSRENWGLDKHLGPIFFENLDFD